MKLLYTYIHMRLKIMFLIIDLTFYRSLQRQFSNCFKSTDDIVYLSLLSLIMTRNEKKRQTQSLFLRFFKVRSFESK